MTKSQIVALVGGVLVVAIGAVIRAKRVSPLGWGWYGNVQTTQGVAVGGYDPVSYFSDSATVGSSSFESTLNGVTFRFASAQHKQAFDADPSQYAPQFGGFCSYAASKGFTATIDPTAFRVHEKKLYLFNDASMRDKWTAELPNGVIEQAHTNWKKRATPE